MCPAQRPPLTLLIRKQNKLFLNPRKHIASFTERCLQLCMISPKAWRRGVLPVLPAVPHLVLIMFGTNRTAYGFCGALVGFLWRFGASLWRFGARARSVREDVPSADTSAKPPQSEGDRAGSSFTPYPSKPSLGPLPTPAGRAGRLGAPPCPSAAPRRRPAPPPPCRRWRAGGR